MTLFFFLLLLFAIILFYFLLFYFTVSFCFESVRLENVKLGFMNRLNKCRSLAQLWPIKEPRFYWPPQRWQPLQLISHSNSIRLGWISSEVHRWIISQSTAHRRRCHWNASISDHVVWYFQLIGYNIYREISAVGVSVHMCFIFNR